MPNPREPINILLAKGRKHLTQEEIQRRMATEPTAPADDIQPPDYLSKKQREEFSALAGELQRTLPKKKRARLRELRARLAAEEGRAVAAGEEIDDEDVALELERSLALLQDKYFTQCEATARALGLNITSRCKLVIPQEPPVPKSNKFDRFKKLAEGE